LRDRKTITISESTKKDLQRVGHKAKNIFIISEGIELTPIKSLESVTKFANPTLLSFGAIRPMKRTLDIVIAFEIAKADSPNLRLIVAGDTSGPYGNHVLDYIKKSIYKNDIEILGRVSTEKKIEVMQKSHVLAVTSVKEGWGLIVTEANSQGLPAVVYNVDGLRDSVQQAITGYISKNNNPASLADCISELIQNDVKRIRLSGNAFSSSKLITFEKSYRQLLEVLKVTLY